MIALVVPSRVPFASLTLLLCAACGSRSLSSGSASSRLGAGNTNTESTDSDTTQSDVTAGQQPAPSMIPASNSVVPGSPVAVQPGSTQPTIVATPPDSSAPTMPAQMVLLPASPPPDETMTGEQPGVNGGSDNCWLEALPYGIRCEETFGVAGDSFDALSDCADECLADPSCTSVSDYTYLDLGLPCSVQSTGCTPDTGISYEEDAAKEYVKVCGDTPPEGALFALSDAPGLPGSPGSGCRFLALDDYTACENTQLDAVLTFGTLQQCFDSCEQEPDCSAVMDWWFEGPPGVGCALHLSTCDAPSAAAYDTAEGDYRTFVKSCTL